MSELLQFPSTEDRILSCRALISNDDGELLVLRRAAGYSLADKWEFPGGGIKPGETDYEALHREAEEETGLTDFSLVDHSLAVFEERRIKDGKHKGETIVSVGGVAITGQTDVQTSHEHSEFFWGRPSIIFSEFDLTLTSIAALHRFGRAISRL